MKVKTFNILVLPILLFTSLLCGSCEYVYKMKRKAKLKADIENISNTQISFPDTLHLFHKGNISKINAKSQFKKDLKIITFIDNDCPKCTFSQLIHWSNFMEDYRTNRDFDILFFYNGNNDYICNVLLDEAEFQMPVILDVDSIFHKSYEIFENPTYRTMLLGKDNKPLLIGNIVGNKKMENLYRKELSK